MESVRVVWPEKGRADLESFVPAEPRPGEVLIETEVTLISPGTERAFFLGLPNAQGRYPSNPGYSNVGRIAALGEGVTGLQIGDRVASGGNHASHVVVRTSRCWPVPPELPATEAVFFNLAAIALQGVRKARVELGEAVLGLGLGLIGNLALQLARLQGGLPTIGLDPDAGRRETATTCSVDAVLDPTASDAPDRLGELTAGRGPSVVIEATGSPEAVNDALALAGHRARVVLLASTRGVTETNFYRDVHRKGLTLLGAHANVVAPHDSSPGFWTQEDDMKTVLRLLAARRLQVVPLRSEIFPWKEAPRAYELLGSWRKDLLGMVLRWRGE
jgi:2-desacetyl-2-hydroxyethyl bacteriochlorophyllide A dehydrogenase